MSLTWEIKQHKKLQVWKTNRWLPQVGGAGWEHWVKVVKRCKLPAKRWISFEDIMYIMGTRVSKTALLIWKLLKETSPACSLEGLMLRLKLQYFGYLMQRVDSLEKTLMLGGTGSRRKSGYHRMRWLDGITHSMHMSLGKLR